MTYAKEYDEAMSRLAAPERSPLPYVPPPLGPVPYYKTPGNWNRIMAETRHGVLPKYTIPQRLNIRSDSMSSTTQDGITHIFKLDPTFAFAKGARKSIAVREINITTPVLKRIERAAREKMFFSGLKLSGTYLNDKSEQQKTTDELIKINTRDIDYKACLDKVLTLDSLANAIGQTLLDAIKSSDAPIAKLFDSHESAYLPDTNELQVVLVSKPEANLEITSMLLKNGSGMYWSIVKSNIIDYYNTTQGRIYMTCDVPADNKSVICIRIPLPMEMFNFGQTSVCCSINPWTKNNVIGPLEYHSDTLTKVFPYDGNPEIRIWLMEQDKKIKYATFRGFIDLELIIDNSDSYAIEN